MKAEVFKAIGLLSGAALMGVGSAAIFGNSVVSYVIDGGCLVAMFWLWGDADKGEKQAVANARQGIYDQFTAQGNKLTVEGKPWVQGCRVDPKTGATIEPGV